MERTLGAPQILIIGAGSIGRRHAQNCVALGAKVSIYDVVQSSLSALCKEKGYTLVADLNNAMKTGSYDAALVCTPNHLHVPVAIEVVDSGLDVFIEKPLSHTLDGVEELIEKIKLNNVIAMGGFNLRFEPGLQYLKRIINRRDIAFAQIESGSHMPTWRPEVDYRKTYSANKSMGGGIILDDIHELDYACWLFGYPDVVTCSSGKFSNFEIDVEDTAEFLFKYTDKLLTIHSDYLQKRYARRCRICLRNGDTIEWEFGKHVKEFTDRGEQVFLYQDSFDVNDLYVREMQMFISHIRNRSTPESDITNAARILKIALDAKEM